MTNEKINRAIAEHLGWTQVRVIPPHPRRKSEGSTIAGNPPATSKDRSILVPNYAEDLNAIHKALQSLTEVELFRYADEVCDLTCDSNHDTDIQTMLMLSAKELAECYVRAIGKWRVAEGKNLLP